METGKIEAHIKFSKSEGLNLKIFRKKLTKEEINQKFFHVG